MNYIKQTFPVLEMSCAACAVSVESMLKSVSGVKDAGVNYANQSAWVEYDNTLAQPGDLQNAVRSIGYDLVVNVEDPQAVKEEAQKKNFEEIKKRTIWSSVLAVPMVIIFPSSYLHLSYFIWEGISLPMHGSKLVTEWLTWTRLLPCQRVSLSCLVPSILSFLNSGIRVEYIHMFIMKQPPWWLFSFRLENFWKKKQNRILFLLLRN